MLDAARVAGYNSLDSLLASRLFNLESTALATKKKNAPASKQKSADQTTVTRITATDSGVKKPKKQTAVKAEVTAEKPKKQKKERKQRKNPFAAIGGYFKGAWHELREVRWPNRRATWSMTFAVLAFSAAMIIIVLLLDALFKYLFQLLIG
ncbi:MAG TPA: preprotein translocase subunit SecE [Candidatus Saccharimonadales bacterium]|nr:preprotein translocase subunit SecE [Candidatus Saccharimonadales bacterium]